MNSFKNFWAHLSIIEFVVIGFLIFYMKSCTPKCPPINTSTTVIIDTIYIHDTIFAPKTRLVKKNKSKVKPIFDTKTPVVESIKVCDSINEAFNDVYEYQTDVSDSLLSGTLYQRISKNQILYTEKNFRYLIPTTIDSVILYVDRPTYKSSFTIGTFLSKHSSGLNVGFRTQRVHVAAGYDIANSSPVLNFNFDLK